MMITLFGNDHEEESYLLPAKEYEGANDDGSEDAGEDEEEDDEPVLRFAIHPCDFWFSSPISVILSLSLWKVVSFIS